MQKLSADIALRNIHESDEARHELIDGGGKSQVPCLRITENNETRWMYESDDIIDYLESRFS